MVSSQLRHSSEKAKATPVANIADKAISSARVDPIAELTPSASLSFHDPVMTTG